MSELNIVPEPWWPVRPPSTYDEKHAKAVEVTWLCCRRTVFATNVARGCLRCVVKEL